MNKIEGKIKIFVGAKIHLGCKDNGIWGTLETSTEKWKHLWHSRRAH